MEYSNEETIMRPAEDTKYMDYCQKAIDKAQDEYEAVSKHYNFFLKALMGSGIIAGISVIILLLALSIDHPGAKTVAIVVLTVSFVVCWGMFEEVLDRQRVRGPYEECTTCAEKINTYAYSYEKWLTIKAEKSAREKSVEESEQVCAALKARPTL